MNLKSSFKAFYELNKFEVNLQQIEIIDLLDKFVNQKETFFNRFFKKRINFVLSIWKSRCRQNNVT